MSVKVDTGSDGPYLRFNADSGTNYPIVTMDGNGTTATSATFTAYTALAIANNAYVNATTFTQYNTNIMDYSATDKHKSVLSRGNNAALAAEAIAGRWANTAAITSIGVVLGGARNWAAGSTFALYGVAA